MFSRSLIKDLCCPYCGSNFQNTLDLNSSTEEIQNGILKCDCYEYPIVNGILVLKQMSPVTSIRNEAIIQLKRGDTRNALFWLLENGNAVGVPFLKNKRQYNRTNRFIKRFRVLFQNKMPFCNEDHNGSRLTFKEILKAFRPGLYAEYLYHRYVNPSLLGAIPPLIIFGKYCETKNATRIVDLLCGIGHSSSIFGYLCPKTEIIAADGDFVNLYLAQKYVVKSATSICLDAELPLPFLDGSVDGIFCLDGLHYVRSKNALLKEVNRVINPQGMWIFAHMHSSEGENENPGSPLDLATYLKLFNFGYCKMISEKNILKQFQKEASLDLTTQEENWMLSSSPTLTMIGSRTEDIWKKHDRLDETLYQHAEMLGFNPIYFLNKLEGGIILKAKWPSRTLKNECIGKGEIEIKDQISISARLFEEILKLGTTNNHSDDISKLLQSYVIVPLPSCYHRN